MIIHQWGEIEYKEAREKMQAVHTLAYEDGQNHLILCSHPDIFTIGTSEKKSFDVDVIQSDRGGSITCHSPGQNIYYFCFQVKSPAQFYKKVISAFEAFFIKYLPQVKYHKEQAGFYIQNRKIASLGFRYSQGLSLHGVSLNVDVDLDFHVQVNPCNIEGIIPTSLVNENLHLSQEMVNRVLVHFIEESFYDTAV